jgi:hypothetical protein
MRLSLFSVIVIALSTASLVSAAPVVPATGGNANGPPMVLCTPSMPMVDTLIGPVLRLFLLRKRRSRSHCAIFHLRVILQYVYGQINAHG